MDAANARLVPTARLTGGAAVIASTRRQSAVQRGQIVPDGAPDDAKLNIEMSWITLLRMARICSHGISECVLTNSGACC